MTLKFLKINGVIKNKASSYCQPYFESFLKEDKKRDTIEEILFVDARNAFALTSPD
jgi:hypothetical protein